MNKVCQHEFWYDGATSGRRPECGKCGKSDLEVERENLTKACSWCGNREAETSFGWCIRCAGEWDR